MGWYREGRILCSAPENVVRQALELRPLPGRARFWKLGSHHPAFHEIYPIVAFVTFDRVGERQLFDGEPQTSELFPQSFES